MQSRHVDGCTDRALVVVQAHSIEFPHLTVQEESLSRLKFDGSDPETRSVTVFQLVITVDAGDSGI